MCAATNATGPAVSGPVSICRTFGSVVVASASRTFPSRDIGSWRFRRRGCRYRSIKRVASAVGDGGTAVRMVHQYLFAEDISG